MQFDIDIQSVYKNLFLDVRDLLLSNPNITEIKKERITTYSDINGGICHLRTTQKGVDIGFLKGIHLEDKLSLLHGKGKLVRVISLKGYNEVVLLYYIHQAIEINNKKKLVQQF
jgi:hypothetical protein